MVALIMLKKLNLTYLKLKEAKEVENKYFNNLY